MAALGYHMLLVSVVTLLGFSSLYCFKVDKYSLLMPNVRPYMNELYLCTPIRVNYTRNYYIIGFEPNATMDTAHHMLLYGCTEPGSSKPVWNCGEMSDAESSEDTSSPCGQGSQIIYAWARDAPMLELPKGVGFKVGGDSPIQYLVLQVHYAHVEKFLDGKRTDDSGIFLHYTERPMEKLAGVILLGTAGVIPPMTVEHMETSCQIKENKTIHPFAFRAHTHSLGKLVSGYVVKTDVKTQNDWILLGKKDPLLPEMFYPTVTHTAIERNDYLAARCTMESHRNRMTYIGATNKDEMCNFYLMYYVDSGEPLEQKYCFSMGPPYYYWTKSEHFNNIPDREASSPN